MHWASQGTRGAPILPVQFVVGGGPVTLRTVEAAVENRFAVILFRGTGRLCDSLADTACMLPSIEQVVRGRLRALESLVRAKDAQNAPFLQAADSKSPRTIASAATRGLAASAAAAAGRSPEAEHRPIGGMATAARAAIPRPVIGRAGSKARNLAAVPSTPRSLAGLLRSARQPLDEQDITGDAALWVLCADDPARVAMERPVEVCGAGGVTLSAEAEYCAVLPDADRRLMLELLVFGPQLHDLDVGPEDVLEKADEQCGDLRLLGFVASKPGAEQQEAAHRFAIGRALRAVSGSGGAEAWDEARYIKLGSEWLGQVARHVSQRLSQVLGYVFQGRLRHLIPPEPASGVPSARGAVGQWVTVRRVLAVTLRARKALGGGYVICSLEDLAARGRTLLRRRHLSRATAASLGGTRAAEGRASAAGTTAMLQAVGNRVASLETQLEEALALLRAQQGLQSQQSQQQSQQQPSPSTGLGTQGSRRSSDAGLPPGAGRQGLGAVKSRRSSVVPSSQRRAQREDAPASAMVVTPRRRVSIAQLLANPSRKGGGEQPHQSTALTFRPSGFGPSVDGREAAEQGDASRGGGAPGPAASSPGKAASQNPTLWRQALEPAVRAEAASSRKQDEPHLGVLSEHTSQADDGSIEPGQLEPAEEPGAGATAPPRGRQRRMQFQLPSLDLAQSRSVSGAEPVAQAASGSPGAGAEGPGAATDPAPASGNWAAGDFSPAGGQLDASAPRHAPPPEHSEALGEGQPISASVSSDSDGGPVDLGINDLMDWLPDTDPAAAYARTVLDAQTLRDAVAVACLALSVRCEEDESAHGLSVPQALRLCVRWGMAERIGEFVRGCDVYLASSQAAKLGPLTASSGRSRPMPGDTRKRKPHLGPRVVPRGEWGDNVNNLSSVVDAVEDFQRALAEAATKSASSPASLWLSGPMAVASPALSLNVSHRDYAGAKGQLGARAAVLSETVNAGLKVAIRNAASLAASLDRADVLAELAACNPGECLSALQVFAAVEISAWAIAAVQCELRHRDALDAAAELLDDTSCLLDNGFAVPGGSPARARGAASAVGDSVRALAGCRFCCDCTESGGPARASEPGKVRAALRRAALVAKTAAHISAPHVHVAGRLSDGVEATVRVREGTREPSFWLGFFLGTVMRSATGKAALREHDRLSKHPDCDSDAVLERKAVNAARLASRPMMGKFLRLRCDKDACNLVESSLPAIWAAVTGRLLVVRFAWRLASSPLRVCLYCAHLLRISSDENSARKASILETATFLEGMAIQLIREAGCTTSPSSWDAGSIELAALWLRSQAEPEWELIDAFLDAHGSKRLGTDAWLLSRRTPLFCEQDPMTILALAAAADCKRFLAEPVVQAVVDELWFCSRWVPDLTAGSDSILSPRPHGKHAAKQSDLLARLGDVDKARTVLKAEQWSQSRPVKSGGKPADGSGARHGDTSKLWAHQLHTPRAKHFAMLVSSLIMLVLHALAALGVRGSSEAVHVEWALACFVAGFAFDDLSLIVRERQLGPLLSDWTTCCFRQSAHGMPRPRCTLRGRRQCSEVAMFHAVLIVSNMLFATTLVLRLVGWGAQIPALGEGAQDLLAFLAVTSGMRVLSLLGAFRTVGVLFIVVREIIKTNLLVWGALAFFILGPMLATFASVFVLRNNSAQDTATSSLFWAIFGMDFALGTNVEASEVPYAPALPQLADALTSVFLLTVLILVNLLVAQMAQTFEAVSSHADMEIRFERVPSTRHFLLSSCLPPPLNLLEVAVKEVMLLCFGSGPSSPLCCCETRRRESCCGAWLLAGNAACTCLCCPLFAAAWCCKHRPEAAGASDARLSSVSQPASGAPLAGGTPARHQPAAATYLPSAARAYRSRCATARAVARDHGICGFCCGEPIPEARDCAPGKMPEQQASGCECDCLLWPCHDLRLLSLAVQAVRSTRRGCTACCRLQWCSDAQRVYAKAVHPLEARERGRLKWLRQSALRAVALANSLQDHPGPS